MLAPQPFWGGRELDIIGDVDNPQRYGMTDRAGHDSFSTVGRDVLGCRDARDMCRLVGAA